MTIYVETTLWFQGECDYINEISCCRVEWKISTKYAYKNNKK
jgi:hypothetical protein